MRNIINKNNKFQLHGYQEWYYSNGKLCYKCFFNKNGIKVDYEEFYLFNGKLTDKSFYI